MFEGLKQMIQKWLQIQPAQDHSILIQEAMNYEQTVMRNRVWYRGDPSEIEQFHHQTATDEVGKARFWAVSPSKTSNKIRKYHSGLPGMIVNSLADIVVTDMLDVDFKDLRSSGDLPEVWKQTAEENNIKNLVTKAVQETLTTGDGAFKVSIDTDLSQFPIIEFYSGENVEYLTRRGRVQEVIFKSLYRHEKRTYVLIERYGKDKTGGYVRYLLTTEGGAEVDIRTVPELANLKDVTYKGDFIMAVPLKFYPSPKWPDRGRSIFDLKSDAFDSLDETISQWQDAIRLGRVKRYIPESMIPRNPETGQMEPVNPLDNVFSALRDVKNENGESRIMTDQPVINYEGYLGTYINNLDICLQGIISPSTLGIDTKRLDNAEAQREKEKTTLYTRDKIISVLSRVLPELVDVTLKTYCNLKKIDPVDIDCTVEFGEYANPSFEAQIETMGKAASTGIMSVEAMVNTLWGDTKEESWKAEEVQRIKALRGIVEVDEPSMKPNGFAPEAEMELLSGLDRLDRGDTDRARAESVRVNGSEPEAAYEQGARRAAPMDAMAGVTAEEPEETEARLR